MDFEQYFKLYTEQESLSDIRKYIDSRFDDLKAEMPAGGDGGFYNVVPNTAGRGLTIIDVKKGAVVGTLSPKGKLISAPIVRDNEVSFAVQTADGATMGVVHELPSGAQTNQFRVASAKPGKKFKQLQGAEEDEPAGLPIEPEEIDDEDDQLPKEITVEKPVHDHETGEFKRTVNQKIETFGDLIKQVNSLSHQSADAAREIKGMQDKLRSGHEDLEAKYSKAFNVADAAAGITSQEFAAPSEWSKANPKSGAYHGPPGASPGHWGRT